MPRIKDSFVIDHRSTNTSARTGYLHTLHGTVETPAFLPVASQGSVKSLTPHDLKQVGVSIILGNVYHLYLRPGIDVIEKLGGLHEFMGWEYPILTDSGGYQIFSLSPLCKISDEGALFRSHIDGSEHFLSPERAIIYQESLGTDIIMALDECISHDCSRERIKEAMERTLKWAVRCKKQHMNKEQPIFAIVQGGTFAGLRKDSALALAEYDFSGYAIGGLSLGESKELTWSMTDIAIDNLPGNKPRYLMGIGSPEDILEGVSGGIDIFDSALPTRVARNGALYTLTGRQNILKGYYRSKDIPFDPDCDCFTCSNFSAAYLHHLFKAGELLALRLATLHNLRFMMRLMHDIRQSISQDNFPAFRKEFLAKFRITDESARISQKMKWIDARRNMDEHQ